MKKQTAVEIFYSAMKKNLQAYREKHIPFDVLVIQTAKAYEASLAMEKEQMDNVSGDWWSEGASYMYDGKRKYESFEQYYNETYNTDTQ
jgi:hypothetical protein